MTDCIKQSVFIINHTYSIKSVVSVFNAINYKKHPTGFEPVKNRVAAGRVKPLRYGCIIFLPCWTNPCIQQGIFKRKGVLSLFKGFMNTLKNNK